MALAAFALLQSVALCVLALSEKTISSGLATGHLRVDRHQAANWTSISTVGDGVKFSPDAKPETSLRAALVQTHHHDSVKELPFLPKETADELRRRLEELQNHEDYEKAREKQEEKFEEAREEQEKTFAKQAKELQEEYHVTPDSAEETQELRHNGKSFDDLHHKELIGFVIIPIALAVTSSLFLGGMIERAEISWFPESVGTIIIGVVLGHYMRLFLGEEMSMFRHEEVFNYSAATLLTLFLLPMLIFESGWSLRTKDFASQFQYILVFAVIGSLISFGVVGGLIYGTGMLGWHSVTMWRTAFAYASLVAATDPVSTLATYSKLKVDPLLNIMVFGDSTFNDAVAIVLFKVLNSDAIMGTPQSRPSNFELTKSIGGGIILIFMGSLFIGVAVSSVFLLALRFTHMRHAPRLEILSLVCVAYMTFGLAELLDMSGIVATIFGSIMLGIYARPHLSLTGSILSNFFLAQVAHVMDTAVFLLTGFCVVQLGTHGFWFAIFVVIFCLIGRAAATFPLGVVVNGMKRMHARAFGIDVESVHLLNKETMFMMWHAGLRGAISLTLSMQLGPWVDIIDGPETRHLLQTATYCMILVFLVVFGGSTEFCLKHLKIHMGEQTDPEKLYQQEVTASTQRWLTEIDQKFMVPLFIGEERLAESVDERQKLIEVEDIVSVPQQA